MKSKQTLGKVISQIGGLKIREVQTKEGMEYGLYAGKRLFKQMLNPSTLVIMGDKILKSQKDAKKGIHHPYSNTLWNEYQAFMKNSKSRNKSGNF